MLVHHYTFYIDLITLPDVEILIYLEPILAKEWKTIRAVWKHWFLKLPTFFLEQDCFNLIHFCVDKSVCLICRNRAIVFISIL